MQPYEAWAAFTAVIVGAPVEDAEAKFRALSPAEQDGWSAAAGMTLEQVQKFAAPLVSPPNFPPPDTLSFELAAPPGA